VKNQHRWNFGIVYPQDFSTFANGVEPCRLTTECLVTGPAAGLAQIDVRFLQTVGDGLTEDVVERSVSIEAVSLAQLIHQKMARDFEFDGIQGRVEASARSQGGELLVLRSEIINTTPWTESIGKNRAALLRLSFISTHSILELNGARFVSLTDPPTHLAAAAASCKNIGTWPVLVGSESEQNAILSSPIILPDFPRTAPESSGDLFDGTEIDEILTLRILTLTDAEKEEVRRADPRAKEMLERVEALTPDQLMHLHGVARKTSDGGTGLDPPPLRGVPLESGTARRPVNWSEQPDLRPGDRVRLRPSKRGDILDVVLNGRIAIIESIERDFEDRVHLAVVVEDDPGKDLGFDRQPGHRFFFSEDEVERVA
jgi:hypothetical protein